MKKSGKVIITSVDLKVQDARSKKDRTFRPNFEVADLGPDEDIVLGMDWFSLAVEKIVIGPPAGLEFKSPISTIKSNTVEFNNVLQSAAYIGVITIDIDTEMKGLLKRSFNFDVDSNTTFHCPDTCNEPERHIHWKKGNRVMSINISDEDKVLMENVPVYYHEFHKVFGKEMQLAFPAHGPQDIAINLKPNSVLPTAKLYPMSQDELQILREDIEEMVMSGKIRPGSGPAGCPVFFVKEKTGKMRLHGPYPFPYVTVIPCYPETSFYSHRETTVFEITQQPTTRLI